MAITTCMPNSAKQEFLKGLHLLATHTFKLVLIKTGHGGTYDKNTQAYGSSAGTPSVTNLGTDACGSSGTYASNTGVALAGGAVSLSADTAVFTFTAPAAFTGATISADGALIYNDSLAGKPVIAVMAFAGAPIASTNGTFTITMPTPDAATGLIRMA